MTNLITQTSGPAMHAELVSLVAERRAEAGAVASALGEVLTIHTPKPWHAGQAEVESDICGWGDAAKPSVFHHHGDPWGRPHAEFRCAGESHVDEDGGSWTSWPCRTFAVAARALGVELPANVVAALAEIESVEAVV